MSNNSNKIKNNKKNATKEEKEEGQDKEAALLASIGSTVASASTYESSVIREKQYESVPTLLESNDDNDDITFGFPDLSGLIPSFSTQPKKQKVSFVGKAAAAGKTKLDKETRDCIPHVLSVLQKTRQSIYKDNDESYETNIQRMKEQILLSFLTNVAQLSKQDAMIDTRSEVLSERKRSAALWEERDGKMKEKRRRTKQVMMQEECDLAFSSSRSSSPLLPALDTAAAAAAAGGGGMTVSQRLEQIKKGTFTFANDDDDDKEEEVNIISTSRTASFGKQALEHQNSSRHGKKQSMMSMKNLMRIQDGADDVETQSKLIEERRRNREKRRENRRRRRGEKYYPQDQKEEEGEEKRSIDDKADDGETEMEFHGVHDKKSASSSVPQSSIKGEEGNEAETETNTSSNNNIQANEAKLPNNKSVYCPNCQQNIPIPTNNASNDDGDNNNKNIVDADLFLSNHINTCQTTNKRHNTRPLRKRKQRVALNYNEDEDDEHDEEDMDEGKEHVVCNRRQRATAKKKAKRATSPLSSSAGAKNPTKHAETTTIKSGDDDVYVDNVDDNASTSENSNNSPSSTPPPPEIKAIDDMEEFQYEDRIEEWTQNGISKMKDMSERDSNETPPGKTLYDGGLEVPAWINNKLFPYQRTSLQWMWELHRQKAGGIIGDEMGLGKTVQVASFLGVMASNRTLDSVLIVCPATMLSHWLSELSIWAPGLRRILIHKMGEQQQHNGGMSSSLSLSSRTISTKLLTRLQKWLKRCRHEYVNEIIDEQDLKDYDEDIFVGTGYAVVTTYENIRRNMDAYTDHDWTYVVLDEGQKIRNPDADVTLTCKRIRTPHRLLLSGTPIQNDLRELWSLFDFVFPGRLGTLPAFENEFADPIKRGGYANASPMQVQLAYRCAMVLRDLINPFMLRRMKKDIREVSRMPGKTEQVLFCRLSDRQRALYEAYLKSDEVVNILRGSTQLFRSITILRKICNHPDLVCGPDQSSFDSFVREGNASNNDPDSSSSEDFGDDDIDGEEYLVQRSGKFEVLAKILPLWKEQGHRVLIFCQWTKMLNIIQRFTALQGWKFLRMDGSTNVGSRQRMVDDFNRDDTYFGMLMTTRTGGVGLNLTGADRIILYDPDWNPQTDAQARERAWRFGQKNAVTVYRLITAGTIEEKIYHRQIFKTAVTNQVLQDPRQRRLFSQRDLRDLFTLKADVGSVAKGGDGCTETAAITKGAGVIDPVNCKDLADPEDGTGDNEDTLEEVLKSKGLAGVFDHDFVDNSSASKSKSVREMEEQAKIVAQRAAKALKESSSGQKAFVPTWTGSTETESHRFGGRRGSAAPAGSDVARFRRGSATKTTLDFDQSFGGAKSAGLAKSVGNCASSSALISQLKQRRQQISNGGKDVASKSTAQGNEMKKYTELLKSMRDFIVRRGGSRRGSGPTTEELLAEFRKVSDHDAAIFKRLLNCLARLEEGKWCLK